MKNNNFFRDEKDRSRAQLFFRLFLGEMKSNQILWGGNHCTKNRLIQFEWWKEMTKMKDKHCQWLNIEKQPKRRKNYEDTLLHTRRQFSLTSFTLYIAESRLARLKKTRSLKRSWISFADEKKRSFSKYD